MRARFITLVFFLFALGNAKAFSGKDSSRLLLSREVRTSFLMFSAGYRMPLNENKIINSGRGLYVEGGLNPGFFLSKKMVLGAYLGWAWKDILWNTSFHKSFIRDYQPVFRAQERFSGLDSAVIQRSKELVNGSGEKGREVLPGCRTGAFHSYSLYYGVMIKLPFRFAPALKLYRGCTGTAYRGEDTFSGQGDYHSFEFRRAMKGCELMIFEGMTRASRDENYTHPFYMHIGAVSVYYESCNFYTSSLYFNNGREALSIPLQRFLPSASLARYKKEISWGLKISFCIL